MFQKVLKNQYQLTEQQCSTEAVKKHSRFAGSAPLMILTAPSW